jgi:hypothetical protein
MALHLVQVMAVELCVMLVMLSLANLAQVGGPTGHRHEDMGIISGQMSFPATCDLGLST